MAFAPFKGYSLRLQQVIQSFGIDPALVHDLKLHFPRSGVVTATITVAVDPAQIEAIEDAAMDVQEANVEQTGPIAFRGGSAAFMGNGLPPEVIERFMPQEHNGDTGQP